MLNKIILAGALAFVAAPAFGACPGLSAYITGRVGGAEFKNGLCHVLVDVTSAKANRFCGMRVGKTITVSVPLSERKCPQDEGPVEGTVSSKIGSKLISFKGRLDRHKL